MNQKTVALIAIAVVIQLAMFWVAYSGGILYTANPLSSENNIQSTGPHTPKVVASFFPLYDFARHVGGNKINATTMVPVGVEPHDWEPTAQQILNLRSADLFVYNGAGIDAWGDKVETKLR